MDHTYFADSSNLPRIRNYKSHKKCSVPQCNNRVGGDRNISLHRFPGDMFVRMNWIRVFKLGTMPKYPYACSDHFCCDDFVSPTKNKKRLKPEAIPSRNLPLYSAATLKKQAQKENRKEWSHRKQLFYQKISIHPTEESVSIPKIVIRQEKPAPPIKEAEPPIAKKKDVPVQVKAVVPRLPVEDRPKILNLIQSDADMQICTNLTIQQFHTICEMVKRFVVDQIPMIGPEELNISSKLLLTLMKLKENHSFSHLSFLFGVTVTCCSSTFYEMIEILREVLRQFITWPSKEEIQRHLPKQFNNWPHTRVVIDCIEIEVSSSRCFKCSNSFCSHLKQKPTIKFLVGMAPSGRVTFLTDVYDGETPAKTILDECGLLNLCEPGDTIIANRGFLVDEPCQAAEKPASQPPILGEKSPFSNKKTEDFKPVITNTKPANTKPAVTNTRSVPGNTRPVAMNTKPLPENTRPVATSTKPVAANTRLTVANTQPGARAKVHIKTVERIQAYGIINSPITSEMFNAIDLITNVICALVNFTTPLVQNE